MIYQVTRFIVEFVHVPYIVRNSAKQTATTFDCVRHNTRLTYTVTRDPVLFLTQSKVVAVCLAEFRTIYGMFFCPQKVNVPPKSKIEFHMVHYYQIRVS